MNFPLEVTNKLFDKIYATGLDKICHISMFPGFQVDAPEGHETYEDALEICRKDNVSAGLCILSWEEEGEEIYSISSFSDPFKKIFFSTNVDDVVRKASDLLTIHTEDLAA